MPVDRPLFREICDALTPHLDEGRRRSVLQAALFDCPALDDIVYSGDSRTFATNLVALLFRYSELEPGTPAVAAVLDEVGRRLGEDRRAGFASLAQRVRDASVAAGAGPSAARVVLFLAAQSYDAEPLELARERRAIRSALQQAGRDPAFVFEAPRRYKAGDLQRHLLRHRPELVHFSGHGTKSGALHMEDERGETILIAPETLSGVFSLPALRETVRCVVANACYSSRQARAIAAHVPFVVGMAGEVEDRDALAFSSGFYLALSEGLDYEQAFAVGRRQVELSGSGGGKRPHLCVNRGGQILESF